MATARPAHLHWFDDGPATPRASRAARAAEKRAKRLRVRTLASALPRPVRLRPTPPRPAKAAGMHAPIPRAVIDRARIRVPRRLAIPSAAARPHRTLISWFGAR